MSIIYGILKSDHPTRHLVSPLQQGQSEHIKGAPTLLPAPSNNGLDLDSVEVGTILWNYGQFNQPIKCYVQVPHVLTARVTMLPIYLRGNFGFTVKQFHQTAYLSMSINAARSNTYTSNDMRSICYCKLKTMQVSSAGSNQGWKFAIRTTAQRIGLVQEIKSWKLHVIVGSQAAVSETWVIKVAGMRLLGVLVYINAINITKVYIDE